MRTVMEIFRVKGKVTSVEQRGPRNSLGSVGPAEIRSTVRFDYGECQVSQDGHDLVTVIKGQYPLGTEFVLALHKIDGVEPT